VLIDLIEAGDHDDAPVAADSFIWVERREVGPGALASMKLIAQQLAVINFGDNVIRGDGSTRTALDGVILWQHWHAEGANLPINAIAKSLLTTRALEFRRSWRRGRPRSGWTRFMMLDFGAFR
jgi:hypothetical protein